MNPYESIETLYIRKKDGSNKLDFTQIRSPEWQSVKQWYLTEKVDGTNIRVIIDKQGITVKGRSDNAQLPPGLKDSIEMMFDHERITTYFKGNKPNGELAEDWCVTFYGEGYGPGIKGSEPMQYKPQGAKKGFRCFDIKWGGLDSNHWADIQEWTGICASLDILPVNLIGWLDGDLPIDANAAYTMMNTYLPRSYCAFEDGGTQAHGEGVVARTEHPLFDRWGNRLMWKLTRRDLK